MYQSSVYPGKFQWQRFQSKCEVRRIKKPGRPRKTLMQQRHNQIQHSGSQDEICQLLFKHRAILPLASGKILNQIFTPLGEKNSSLHLGGCWTGSKNPRGMRGAPAQAEKGGILGRQTRNYSRILCMLQNLIIISNIET